MNSFLHQASFATGYWYYDRHRSVRLVILVGLAIDQIAQSGLSSLSVIYYSAQLFSNLGVPTGDDLATGFAEFYQSMGISYAYSNIETALLNKGLSLGGPQWATEARNLFNQGNCELVLGK
ncbi:hypothetical protein [Klebsiella sp. WP4-W18-ESBL-05]|uniref:hypothetical protein n=1 Tax=Klebsiella sp. WP4-W18-ESBL-05 TaxID=2675713 RepID=UPI0016012130|nr:hypothetical protein [Klebsiella sp. WP4-W18-ESBL-05]